jgi:hypothetical protein
MSRTKERKLRQQIEASIWLKARTDKYLKGIPDSSRAAKPHGFLNEKDITEERLDKIRKLNEGMLKWQLPGFYGTAVLLQCWLVLH